MTIVVSVDDPHPVYFGGVVAAPVFKNVAADTVRYLKTKQSLELQGLNENRRVN